MSPRCSFLKCRIISRRSVFAAVLLALSLSLLVAAVVPLEGVSAPAGPAWTLLNSPNINSGLEDNLLVDVVCITANDCWSVGYKEYDSDDSSGHYKTLIQHWNGSVWSVVDSPSVTDSPQSQLYAIACNSTADCWAVGHSLDPDGYAHSLVEHWDGTMWAIVASPTNDNGYLRDVTCNGLGECWAVGYSKVFSSSSIAPLIEYWNGTSWTVVQSASSIDPSTALLSVTCVATSDCWVAGYSAEASGNHHTFVEHWNGSSWSAAVSLNASGAQQNDLNQITCNSSTDCWAVGRSHVNGSSDFTLIERWNGVTWTIVGSPNAGDTNVLNGVECAAANDCWATGYASSITQGVTLILHWNGSTWSQAASASRPNEYSALYGVTCMTESDCWSIGSSSYYRSKTLTEHWNGTSWALVASPTINDGPRDNELRAVDCTAVNDCWAVGSYEQELSPGLVSIHGVLMHWDGNAWKVWETLGDASFFEGFYGVDCITSSDCWAVGTYNTDETLTAHWDGSSWYIVSSPNMADPSWKANGDLRGISCNSSADCWAVGYWQTQTNRSPLIEHWNGSAWSIVPSPDIGASSATRLLGVACTSSTNCFAVGSGDYNHGTVILHWNGTTWSLQSTVGSGILDAIACPQADDCWAVGRFNNPNVTNAMIAHWNGGAWSALADNTATGSYDELHSVSCPVPERCYAAGTTNGTTLIKQLNNGAWATVSSADGSDKYSNHLYGVNCVAGGYCFAVGWYGGYQQPDQTIIEGRTLADVSPTPTPTPTPTATPPMPTPSPTATPIVSVSVSPSAVGEGNDANFIISAKGTTVRPLTVFYSMSGTAAPESDYTLSGATGEVTIPIGEDSAVVTLHAISDAQKEKDEKATMTLQKSGAYSFGAKKKKKKAVKSPAATVTIISAT